MWKFKKQGRCWTLEIQHQPGSVSLSYHISKYTLILTLQPIVGMLKKTDKLHSLPYLTSHRIILFEAYAAYYNEEYIGNPDNRSTGALEKFPEDLITLVALGCYLTCLTGSLDLWSPLGGQIHYMNLCVK